MALGCYWPVASSWRVEATNRGLEEYNPIPTSGRETYDDVRALPAMRGASFGDDGSTSGEAVDFSRRLVRRLGGFM